MLTKNNALHLATCLNALQDFHEIIIVDGYSSDATREIAGRCANVRIIDQPRAFLDADGRILDFSAVRNVGLAHASMAWILMVDTGELLPPAFIDEVRKAVSDVPSVYYANRIFFVDGRRIDRCSGYPARQIRLFHRSCTSGYVKTVHERLQLHPETEVRFLSTPLPEVMPPYTSLAQKYAYYRRLEYRRLGVLPWSRWFRHILWRNIRSCIGLGIKLLGVWLLPGQGNRMPIKYEYAYMLQLCRLTIGLMPFIAQKRKQSSGLL